MPKLDGKLMHESLQALCVPGEKYYHAVYGKVRKSGGSTSPINNIYGFVAITDMQRLLVAGFTMFGEPMGKMCVPLHMIKSMKVNKTIFGQKSVKIEIDNQGEDIKLDCTFAENVYAMGLPNQKENLDELIKIIDNRDALLKAAESCQKLQKIQAWIAKQPNMQSTGVVPLEKMAELRAQQATQPKPTAEKPVQKKVHKGPDPVAMLKREMEYALSLCDRLEAKYGKAEFGAPLAEREIARWEAANQVTIPEDLKEWLKFAGKSRFKGIPLEFYPITRFRKEQDYVVIGKRENATIAFETECDRYIALEAGNRKNLGSMETILRFWGYDAKELFAEEELEKLRPIIEEETLKMKQAQQRAGMPGAGVKEAMDYFLTKHNIGYLYKWRTFPKCPIRKDIVDCGLVISEPDRDGYYQWKPQKQTAPVDFADIEARLGFSLHKDIKALVSSHFYFALGGDMDEKNFDIPPLLPITNIEKYVMDRFEKESYAGDYDFILKGHFFHLGGACIGGDDAFVLEVNNETGEVLAVEYMDKRHEKFANSLYDLFMNATPIWYQD
ncbi:MAG: SecY-interacting protein Syd [Lachnospiraceae bacterium]|nr:SecY-interacting protein Syd [Lachnospiraceae bacterium]